MFTYYWLYAVLSLTAISCALPQLPHFELQQAEIANEAATEQSIKNTCKRIAALTSLSNVATNQTLRDTLLADKKLSQDQANDIATKKDAIASELQDLSTNTTLTAECGVINAHRKAAKDCKKLDKLQKLVELANNETAYNEHLAGELLNQKQTEQLKKNMEEASIKLQALRSNSTLTELCTNEVGLQNGAVRQEVGDIGQATVDNSGAISLSTSDAPVFTQVQQVVLCALGMAWLGTNLLI